MNKKQQSFLSQAAQQLHLAVDERSGILFGEQGGMKMILMPSTANRDYAALVFSLTRGGQEPDAAELREFAKGNKLVMNCAVRRNRVEFILKAHFGSVKKIDRMEQAAREIGAFLRGKGYVSCCQGCGQVVDAEPCVMAGVPSLLCDSCYQQLGASQEQQEASRKPENAIAGAVGALLGSVLGVGCIVLLGQLGYVAALSGIVMAICVLKGYELLGGNLSTKGIVIGCVLMLVMTYVGYRLDWAITVAQYFEASLMDAYQAIPYLIDEEVIEGGAYMGGLLELYLFMLIGAVPTIIGSVNGRKLAKVTYRMQAQQTNGSTPEL